MKWDSHHVIQKQTIELSGNRLEVLQRIESDAMRLAERLMLPVIEGSFSEFTPDDGVLIIDRIELELGVFRANRFEQELAGRLREELARALLPYSRDLRGTSLSRQGALGGDKRAHARTLIRARSGERAHTLPVIVEMLLYYLANGRLSWWSDSVANIRSAWLGLTDPRFVQPITRSIRKSPAAALRAVDSLSDETLAMICNDADPGFDSHVAWDKVFRTLEGSEIELKRCRDLFWTYCVLRTGGHATRELASTLASWIQRLASEIVDETRELLSWAQSGAPPSARPFMGENLPAKETATPPQQESPKGHLASPAGKTCDSSPQIPRPPTTGNAARESSAAKSFDLSGLQGSEWTRSESRHAYSDHANPSEKGDESIYTGLAGIVILHPFLKGLFTARDLVYDNRFVSEDARSVAVRLLDHLACGAGTRPEFELLIPKLLCEMPWEEALSPLVTLNDESERDCDVLLQAAIGHWKALGRASNDGLRQTFLQREGKLEQRSGGWLLRVERKAQDILLDRLPWGFSTIRLPWMTKILHVSWT